jgi:hypothetical protein
LSPAAYPTNCISVHILEEKEDKMEKEKERKKKRSTGEEKEEGRI